MQDHSSSPAPEAHDVAEVGNALRSHALDWRSVTDPEEILALWRVLHDGRWQVMEAFNEGGRRIVVARMEGAPIADVLDERLDPSLSLRERQVACFAALGHTNKHIGHALAIASSTVATHLRHALAKLGARSRADLARRLLDALPPRCPRHDASPPQRLLSRDVSPRERTRASLTPCVTSRTSRV